MEDANLAELTAHYSRGEERGRLVAGRGLLEFTRTTEILLRRLPTAPALVADIGGGPGRYALWLAGLGYRVEHRDLMPPPAWQETGPMTVDDRPRPPPCPITLSDQIMSLCDSRQLVEGLDPGEAA